MGSDIAMQQVGREELAAVEGGLFKEIGALIGLAIDLYLRFPLIDVPLMIAGPLGMTEARPVTGSRVRTRTEQAGSASRT